MMCQVPLSLMRRCSSAYYLAVAKSTMRSRTKVTSTKYLIPALLSPAIEQLAKLCGFNEPEKMEIEHGYKAQQELVEVIARLRGRGAVRNNQCAG